MAVFYDYFSDLLVNFIREFVSTSKQFSLGTLLANENMEGIFRFFFKSGIMQVQLGGPLINLLLPG